MIREFAGDSMVERLRKILNTRLTDDQIIGGVDLTDRGMHKVAATLGVAASSIPTLLNSLKMKIKRERGVDSERALSEKEAPDERFTLEGDVMGTVTIRDTVSGRSRVLQGEEAASAKSEYRRYGAAALRHYIPVTETVLAEFAQSDDDDYDYESEIERTLHGGTFNFPWRIDGHRGFATARFDGNGMVRRILHVADLRGEEMTPDPAMLAKIKKAGQDFVGKE